MSFWGASDPDGLSGDPLTIPQQFDPTANAAGGSGNTLTLPQQFDPNATMGSTSAPTGGPAAPAPSSSDILSLILGLFGNGGGASGGAGGSSGGLSSLFGSSASSGALGGLFGGASGAASGAGYGALLALGQQLLTGLTSQGGPLSSGKPLTYGQQKIIDFEKPFGLSEFGTSLANITTKFGIPTIADLIGTPKFLKPEEYIQNLMGSGNPLEQLLGKYINRSGIQKGYDLSESSPAPFKPGRYADVIQLLSGMGFPKGMENRNLGWKNESELSSMLPNATNLNFNQLNQIAPEIGALVNRSGGGQQGLMALLNQENGLAMKLKNAESY